MQIGGLRTGPYALANGDAAILVCGESGMRSTRGKYGKYEES